MVPKCGRRRFSSDHYHAQPSLNLPTTRHPGLGPSSNYSATSTHNALHSRSSRGAHVLVEKNPFQAILYLTLVVFNKGPFQQHFIFEHVITETFEIKIEPVTCSARCVRSRRTLLPKVFQQPCNFLTSKPLPDLLRSLLPYSSFFWTVNNPAAP